FPRRSSRPSASRPGGAATAAPPLASSSSARRRSRPSRRPSRHRLPRRQPPPPQRARTSSSPLRQPRLLPGRRLRPRPPCHSNPPRSPPSSQATLTTTRSCSPLLGPWSLLECVMAFLIASARSPELLADPYGILSRPETAKRSVDS